MTNLEGRVLRRRRAVDPPPGVRTDLQVWPSSPSGSGAAQFFPTDPEAVFDELRRASAGGIADYAGITYERIAAGEGCSGPAPTEDHPGTPRLFADRFATPDGRARFVAGRHRHAAEQPDDDYPYLLTTGRTRTQYQSGTQTRRSPTLPRPSPSPYVEMHPELARRLGIADGEPVRLTTRRGSAVLAPGSTDAIRPDTVFVPVPLGRRGQRQRPDQPRPRPDVPDAGVQDLRGGRRAPPADRANGVAVPAASALVSPCAPHPTRRHRCTAHPASCRASSPFEGQGWTSPSPLHDRLTYTVPTGITTQPLYFRGGNTTDELVTVVLLRDGAPMRYFPIGARDAIHVPLAVVEDLDDGTVLELQLAAPEGLTGTVVVDLGLVEV